jgi:hypothetical protein
MIYGPEEVTEEGAKGAELPFQGSSKNPLRRRRTELRASRRYRSLERRPHGRERLREVREGPHDPRVLTGPGAKARSRSPGSRRQRECAVI